MCNGYCAARKEKRIRNSGNQEKNEENQIIHSEKPSPIPAKISALQRASSVFFLISCVPDRFKMREPCAARKEKRIRNSGNQEKNEENQIIHSEKPSPIPAKISALQRASSVFFLISCVPDRFKMREPCAARKEKRIRNSGNQEKKGVPIVGLEIQYSLGLPLSSELHFFLPS